MGRQVRRTVLVVCEGKADQAFLLYLRSLYCAGRENPPRVDVRQARGRGGDNVVSTLLGAAVSCGPDRLIALLDADVPPSAAWQRKARAKKVELIYARPCLEGLLLKLLGHAVPGASCRCKGQLERIAPGNPFESSFFSELWTKRLLDAKRDDVPELAALLCCFD